MGLGTDKNGHVVENLMAVWRDFAEYTECVLV
jgi:hypothetical protein